jgi:hypothetical protein
MGVNHCSVHHCRLAKFGGLMRRGKYGAVIGLKELITWKFVLGTYKNKRFLTNQSAVFPPSRHTRVSWCFVPSLPTVSMS